MMTYNEFKKILKETVLEQIGKEYKGASVKVEEIKKLNCSYESLQIFKPGSHIAPCINLTELYGHYQKTADLADVYGVIRVMIGQQPEGLADCRLDSYEFVKEKLFLRVSNAKTNKELLETAPHMILGDIAVTYHAAIEKNEEEVGSILITHELLDQYGISEEQLKKDALANAPKVFPPVLENINRVMDQMLTGEGQPGTVPFEEAVEEFGQNKTDMFVLTNERRSNGAAMIVYPGVLDKIAESSESDLFIIPSSIHETLILQDNELMQACDLEAMIRDINANEVSPEDRLSDSLYHFDRKAHVLERTSDFVTRKAMQECLA